MSITFYGDRDFPHYDLTIDDLGDASVDDFASNARITADSTDRDIAAFAAANAPEIADCYAYECPDAPASDPGQVAETIARELTWHRDDLREVREASSEVAA